MHARPNSRRGMTFLEVVVATAMFGVVAAAIVGVFSFTVGTQLREQRNLACAEVANRLVLAYLDDKTKMPDPHKTVEYGPTDTPMKFRWEYREDPVSIVEANRDARDKTREPSPLRADRFRQVSIHVWLSDESGGNVVPTEGTPQFTLTRMFDPLYPRNPDSFMATMMSPAGRTQFFDVMQGKYTDGGTAPKIQKGSRPTIGSSGNGRVGPSDAFGHGRRGGRTGGRN